MVAVGVERRVQCVDGEVCIHIEYFLQDGIAFGCLAQFMLSHILRKCGDSRRFNLVVVHICVQRYKLIIERYSVATKFFVPRHSVRR